ncbi:hypothetical protein HDU91_005517, partial [Kappamyces sp. JEL0680]
MAIKVLLEEGGVKKSQEYKVPLWSKVTYSWLTALFELGLKKPLGKDDLYQLDEENKAEYLLAQFEAAWGRSSTIKDPQWRLFYASVKAFGNEFVIAGMWTPLTLGFWLLLNNIASIISPILIRYLLLWLSSASSADLWWPYTLVTVLFLLQIFSIWSYNHQFELAAKTGYRLRTALSMILYKKYFRLSNSSRQIYSVGKIVNISSVDTLKIDMATQYFNLIWCSMLLLLATFGVLFYYMGTSIIGAFVLVMGYLPVQYYLSKANASFRRSANVFLDKRMRIISESLKGIRVIKAYAWEKSFMKEIAALRETESWYIFQYLAARATTSMVTTVVPTCAMVISFIVYSSMGNQLNLSIIIPSLALFYGLRIPMLFVPFSISFALDAWIGFSRIGEFLGAPELADQPEMIEFDVQTPAIQVKGATFEWNTVEQDDKSQQAPAKFTDISFAIPRGKLVAICGPVGSGKSSILSALIGDMKKKAGEVVISGSVAYCQQQAWIMNSTLQENILFGQPFDETKFNQVLHDCSLERDISILQGGSAAEIGENGINLSGGQKQRLSIARAVYSNADIYLFDDPLSAVDAHVGKALFQNCINGALRKKTRVLVTHQLHFLDQVDSIIFMDDGSIVAQGTYQELLKTCPQFAAMMASYSGVAEQEEPALAKQPPVEETKKELDIRELKQPERKPTALIIAEEKATGAVSSAVYADYTWHAGGTLTVVLLSFWLSTTNVARILTDQWLIWWAT